MACWKARFRLVLLLIFRSFTHATDDVGVDARAMVPDSAGGVADVFAGEVCICRAPGDIGDVEDGVHALFLMPERSG